MLRLDRIWERLSPALANGALSRRIEWVRVSEPYSTLLLSEKFLPGSAVDGTAIVHKHPIEFNFGYIKMRYVQFSQPATTIEHAAYIRIDITASTPPA